MTAHTTSDIARDSHRRAVDILETIGTSQELLAADAAASDASGKIDPRVTEVLRTPGVFDEFAQAEAGVGVLVRLGEGIAEQHPAAAWNTIVSGTTALLARQFAAHSGMTLPADPSTQWCGVFASSVARAERDPQGGHGVSGVWPYASNSDRAQYALLNVAHVDLGPAFVLVPRDHVASRQDWAALGLRGTGSHTLTAEDLRVPDAALLTVEVLFQDDPAGPFGLRVPSRMRTALGLASVAVGSAVALHTACAGSIARSGFAAALGDVVSRTLGAKTLLVNTADRLDDAAASSRPLPAPLLAEARMLLSRVVRDIADAAHEVSLIAGSRACLAGEDVGRLWRDTHVATRHGALSPAVGFELGGRAVVDPAASSAAEVARPLAPGTAPVRAVPAAR